MLRCLWCYANVLTSITSMKSMPRYPNPDSSSTTLLCLLHKTNWHYSWELLKNWKRSQKLLPHSAFGKKINPPVQRVPHQAWHSILFENWGVFSDFSSLGFCFPASTVNSDFSPRGKMCSPLAWAAKEWQLPEGESLLLSFGTSLYTSLSFSLHIWLEGDGNKSAQKSCLGKASEDRWS